MTAVSLFQAAYQRAGSQGGPLSPVYKFSELLDCFWCITHASKAKILIIKTACSDDSDSSMLLLLLLSRFSHVRLCVTPYSPVNAWGHRKCVVPLLYTMHSVSSCAWPEHTSSGNGQRLWYHMHDLHSLITAGWHMPVPLPVGSDLDCLINRNIASESKLGQMFW